MSDRIPWRSLACWVAALALGPVAVAAGLFDPAPPAQPVPASPTDDLRAQIQQMEAKLAKVKQENEALQQRIDTAKKELAQLQGRPVSGAGTRASSATTRQITAADVTPFPDPTKPGRTTLRSNVPAGTAIALDAPKDLAGEFELAATAGKLEIRGIGRDGYTSGPPVPKVLARVGEEKGELVWEWMEAIRGSGQFPALREIVRYSRLRGNDPSTRREVLNTQFVPPQELAVTLDEVDRWSAKVYPWPWELCSPTWTESQKGQWTVAIDTSAPKSDIAVRVRSTSGAGVRLVVRQAKGGADGGEGTQLAMAWDKDSIPSVMRRMLAESIAGERRAEQSLPGLQKECAKLNEQLQAGSKDPGAAGADAQITAARKSLTDAREDLAQCRLRLRMDQLEMEVATAFTVAERAAAQQALARAQDDASYRRAQRMINSANQDLAKLSKQSEDTFARNEDLRKRLQAAEDRKKAATAEQEECRQRKTQLTARLQELASLPDVSVQVQTGSSHVVLATVRFSADAPKPKGEGGAASRDGGHSSALAWLCLSRLGLPVEGALVSQARPPSPAGSGQESAAQLRMKLRSLERDLQREEAATRQLTQQLAALQADLETARGKPGPGPVGAPANSSPATPDPTTPAPPAAAAKILTVTIPAYQRSGLGSIQKSETRIGEPVPGAMRVKLIPPEPAPKLDQASLETAADGSAVTFMVRRGNAAPVPLASLSLKDRAAMWTWHPAALDSIGTSLGEIDAYMKLAVIELSGDAGALARFQPAPRELTVSLQAAAAAAADKSLPLTLEATAPAGWTVNEVEPSRVRYSRGDFSCDIVFAQQAGTVRAERIVAGSDVKELEDEIKDWEEQKKKLTAGGARAPRGIDQQIQQIDQHIQSARDKLAKARTEAAKAQAPPPADITQCEARLVASNGLVVCRVKIRTGL